MSHENDQKMYQQFFEQHKNELEISEKEKQLFAKNFENPEFVKLFSQLTQELARPGGKEDLEKQIAEMEQMQQAR